jgi:hypothetical protein
MPVMLSISTALFALQSEVTALEESRHPERSVLGEVKDLSIAPWDFRLTGHQASNSV